MITGLNWFRRLSLLLIASAVLANAAEVVTIEKIIVTSTVEGVPVSEEQIAATVDSRPGTTFDAKVLSEDIKKLYKTGLFADVLTETTESAPDKVIITFKIKPNPKVRAVAVKGNDKVGTKKLTQKLTQRADALLDDAKVFDDVKAIRKLYQDRGYNKTDITPLIEPVTGTHSVDLTYQIKEEARYKVGNVRFTGNTRYTARQLRSKMQTRFSFWSYIFSTGYFDEALLQIDLDAVYDLYTSKGYLDIKVTEDIAQRQVAGRRINLAFLVAEGQPYQVSSVAIVANTRFTREELLALVQLQSGKTFDSELERKSILAIRGKYEALGYVDVVVFSRHTLDSAAHTVAVVIEVAEGIASNIRDIYISGNQVTKDKVIRRELNILPGDLANPAKMRTARSRLMDLNYFESVDITARATEKEDLKDVDINVKEKSTGRLSLGVGFSSEDSVFGMLELGQSNLDISNWRHPTGGGQRVLLRAQIGTAQQDVRVSFTEPWLFDRRLRLDWDLYLHQRDQDYYTQQNIGTSALLTRPLKPDAPEGSEWQYWKHSAGLRAEQVRLSDFDNDTSQWVKDEEGSYTSVNLIYQIARDSRDRSMNPTRGSRVSLLAELEPEFLASYTTLYRLRVQGTKYIPLRGMVLKLDLEAGVVDSLSGEDPVLFDRFFAGGTNSIRGFDRRAVGPYDDFDNPVGGESLLRGTIELMFPIYEMIHGSVFCDFGNVWMDPYAFNPGDINVTVGPALRLDLPVGPIRLAYGIPVLVRQENLSTSGKFIFDIGWNF